MTGRLRIAIPLFPQFTALDAIGPYDVLTRVPRAEVSFVATERRAHRDVRGAGFVADRAIDEVSAPDVVVVPGGPGEVDVRHDEHVLSWLREVHETSTWTASVCTGSLILAAAGLLDGVRATSHWLALDELARLGAEPVTERVVVAGRIVTAAGVSAGIDMALLLASMLEGDLVAQEIQLSLEYDPQPPFNAGSPVTAPPVVVELARAKSRFARART